MTTSEKSIKPNIYELRTATRRERLMNAASAAANESNMVYATAKKRASLIPFGQPILVGHHSERRDRNFRGKIDADMRRSIALSDKADRLAARASAVGTGGISSDDPDAIVKLTAQLVACQERQERMKQVNVFIRKGDQGAIKALGYSDDEVVAFFKPRGRFQSYSLSNNNANINRLKNRIAELGRHVERVDKELSGNGYIYREDTAENRVMFLFDGKPSEQIRTLLKSRAFKWSPSRKAWVRMLNNAGIYAGIDVCKSIDEIQEV